MVARPPWCDEAKRRIRSPRYIPRSRPAPAPETGARAGLTQVPRTDDHRRPVGSRATAGRTSIASELECGSGCDGRMSPVFREEILAKTRQGPGDFSTRTRKCKTVFRNSCPSRLVPKRPMIARIVKVRTQLRAAPRRAPFGSGRACRSVRRDGPHGRPAYRRGLRPPILVRGRRTEPPPTGSRSDRTEVPRQYGAMPEPHPASLSLPRRWSPC